MDKKIRVLIADDISDTRGLILKLLGMSNDFEVVGEATNGEGVLEFFKQQDADMVLMDINMPILNGLEATRQLMAIRPDVIVVIMSVQSESEYLKKAMLCGAKEYIIKPFSFESLTQTLLTTYQEYWPRIASQREQNQNAKKNEDRASIHAFFSAKGGVGKTFITTQFGYLSSQLENKKVLLIDADLQFGDVALALNLKPAPSIADLFEEQSVLTKEVLDNYIQTPYTNFDILVAPHKPDAAEGITKEMFDHLIAIALEYYQIILLDLGVNYGEITLACLDVATKIHIITTPTVSALHHTKVALGVMQSLNYEGHKIEIILNRSARSDGFNLKEIQQVLGYQVSHTFEDEYQLANETLNRGDVKIPHKGFGKPRLVKDILRYVRHVLK